MNIKTPKDLAITARKQGKTTISYSQINMYKNCPLQWKLTYIDGIKDFKPSMFLVFGTAMHEVLQTYLDKMYKESIVKANELDLHKLLSDTINQEYKKTVDEQGGKHFSFLKEINYFYNDGVEIIDEFKKRRSIYFSKKNTELLGIEIPILCPVETSDKIMVMGFVDLVIKEDDRIKIIDIKTSMFGWKDEKKKNEGDQLRIYKKYFAFN